MWFQPFHLAHSAAAKPTAHPLQSIGKLWILFLDFELCPSGLCVREGVNDFAFGSRELGGSLEIFQGLCDLALLE
jgi:hypothetical protein